MAEPKFKKGDKVKFSYRGEKPIDALVTGFHGRNIYSVDVFDAAHSEVGHWFAYEHELEKP